ncbi:hypothetical protein Ddc_11344 [Ditylenchus destructor]|nr:hypothetical protein Ddc_11344 [Ditylenchus destructor]
MNSFNPDDKHYRCCCNSCHVERGAYLIAIVGIVFSALALVGAVVMLKWGNVISGIIGILLYVSIIYAQKKQNPSLYWPFLIFNGIGIVLIGIYILVLAVMFFMVPKAWQDFIDPEIESMEESKKEQIILAVRVGTAVLIVLFAISEFLSVWFQCVVYRAYQYMKMTHSSLGAHMQA